MTEATNNTNSAVERDVMLDILRDALADQSLPDLSAAVSAIFKLRTAPPAAAVGPSVRLPARAKRDYSDTVSIHGFCDGWDNCLDEVARLNPALGHDDQAYDRNAERLTAEALGVGAGINSEAASVDDIFNAAPDHFEGVRAMVVPEGWRELMARADKRLTDWLELNCCECEGPGHFCGRTEVRHDRDAIRAMLAAPTPEPEPASPWISVEERLPRHGQMVIASGFIFGKPENGRWVEPAIYGDDGEFHPPTQDGNGETVADFDCEMNCTTHWTPLPAAPEQPAKEVQ